MFDEVRRPRKRISGWLELAHNTHTLLYGGLLAWGSAFAFFFYGLPSLDRRVESLQGLGILALYGGFNCSNTSTGWLEEAHRKLMYIRDVYVSRETMLS